MEGFFFIFEETEEGELAARANLPRALRPWHGNRI